MTKTKVKKISTNFYGFQISTRANASAGRSKSLFIILFVFLGFFGLARNSEAATHYVSPTGSATWVNSTNINTPCSASTAMTNAAAGDIIYFRGGTYNLAGPHRPYHGVLEPVNGGTAGSPITFQAYPGENPVMDCQVSDAYDNCFSLGTNAKNYITFDGFTLKTNSGVKMGGMYVGGEGTPRTGNIIIKNMTIDGGSTVVSSTDNREGIRIDANYVTIQRCKLYNFRQVSNWANTAAIKAYFDDHITIENNEIYNSSAGIYFKCDINYSTIRYNFIHDCNEAIHGQVYSVGVDRNLQHNKVYHNVVVNNTFSAIAVAQEDTANADDWEVYNNTIYNSVRGIVAADGSWKVYNNIVFGQTTYQFVTSPLNTLSVEEYNQWGSPFTITYHLYGSDHATYSTLASWMASNNLEGGLHPGTGDLASNPLFQNGSGTFSQLNDFKLAANSPCKEAGKGGVDMGADIDLVGINAGQVQPFCGDGSCNGTETCSSCSSDCGTCIDATPPSISNGSPAGVLPAGATQTTMSVSTNENAACRWSSAAGTAYSLMTNIFSTTGATSHSTTITGLSNGQTYNRYVRCENSASYANTSDYTITFSVASSEGAAITLYPTQDTYLNVNTEVNINNTTLNTYTWPNNQIANAVLMALSPNPI